MAPSYLFVIEQEHKGFSFTCIDHGARCLHIEFDNTIDALQKLVAHAQMHEYRVRLTTSALLPEITASWRNGDDNAPPQRQTSPTNPQS